MALMRGKNSPFLSTRECKNAPNLWAIMTGPFLRYLFPPGTSARSSFSLETTSQALLSKGTNPQESFGRGFFLPSQNLRRCFFLSDCFCVGGNCITALSTAKKGDFVLILDSPDRLLFVRQRCTREKGKQTAHFKDYGGRERV